MSTRKYGGVAAEQRRAERRTALLDAALKIAGEHGVHALTVSGLSRTSGLNDRYFYENFATTDEVLKALFRQILEELAVSLVGAAGAAGGNLEDRVRAGIGATADFLLADPRRARVAFLESASVPALVADRQGVVDLFVALVSEQAREVIDDLGEVDRRSVRFVGLHLFGGLLETARAWLRGDLEMTRDEFVDHATAVFVGTAGLALVDVNP